MNKITRRSFLAFLSLLPSSVHATINHQLNSREEYESTRDHRWIHLINAVIGPYLSVVMVGSSCETPSSLTGLSPWADQFIDTLNTLADTPDRKNINRLRKSYQLRVREDFQCERTSRINGYILSQTEVEIFYVINTMAKTR